jgi:hypothetical protein
MNKNIKTLLTVVFFSAAIIQSTKENTISMTTTEKDKNKKQDKKINIKNIKKLEIIY